jgi:hypothetical protein
MDNSKIVLMNDFFTFHSCGYGTTFAAFPERADQLISCNESATTYLSGLILGDYNDVQLPVIYNEIKGGSSGKRMRDILDTRYPPLYLISDRFKNVLKESDITGWESYPITLFDKKGNRVEGYNGFSITGRAGKMEKFDQLPLECGYSADADGYYFDVETWDGSDLFNTEGSWHIIVNERFIKVLVDNKITACDYCRLTDYGDWRKTKRIL